MLLCSEIRKHTDQGDRMSLIQIITNWHDTIEILFFATLIYYFSQWLINDTQKNLLFYFYGYCITLITAFYGNIPTIATLLFIGSPVALIIFIILHQKTLQRNFITLKNILPSISQKEDWVESLIRCSLIAMNNNKEFLCVIERKDSLLDLINTAFFIDTPLNKGLLNLLLENNSIDTDKLVWITQTGSLRAINAQWKLNEDNLLCIKNRFPSWKQEAAFISSKTDAIILKATPKNRLFDVIVQEKQFEQISTAMVIKLIKKYQGSAEQPKAGEAYVSRTQKSINNEYRA